ncbi:Fungalysin/Thermolysin Propeptide Motif protein [Planctomycetes bacterium Poly30]|uniref:Fungalysin/Thermolysin Propeptide Motif protein n=1 Tax=Saltatorellus ferox TaxID=2528018 RepID=A0A518EXT3_9BACT|nr:Fungalysin/Thermolysin Propeptide Motif protein [Planctomycetes bacterium Poly30]
MFLRTSGSLFVSALFAISASAQTGSFGAPAQFSSSPDVQLSNWQANHGDSWHMATNPMTGTLEMLYGGNAQSPFEPNTSEAADWFALGRYWINQTRNMHLVDGAELVEERFRYLPLGQGNTNDKITVRFQQEIGGVPVESGAINVLFDTSGRLLSIHTTAAPEVESPNGRATIGAGFANLVAAQAFKAEFGVEPTVQGSERLVHAFVDGGETRRWALAWQVEAMFEAEGEQPIGRLYSVDAKGNGILKSENTIHNFDVRGTISSNATPGLTADRAANPPVPLAMPRIRVVSNSAGTVETDRDGNFNFVGVNTPLDLTVDYFGQFTDVRNDTGADYTITFTNVQPNVQNDLLMNPSPTQGVTSQANSQLHINVLRDFIRDRFPTDNTADFRAVSNVNLSSTCNAFYNGSSVNFYSAGGGCNNTAFSTVVAHEMGHWLNVRYGTGNGSDGIGEGNADVFAMYAYDDPVVGRFFSTGGGSVRTGTNTRQFCGDSNPGCYGGVHSDGEVWMGAAWKIRVNLNNALGNAMGDMVADNLFLGWMNSYNQTQIRSIIETQWLTLDDDDGNINNGTPNYSVIDAGFRAQGFPGFDLPFITLSNVTELPNVTTPAADYTVQADAMMNLGTTLTSVELFSRTGNGSFVSDLMSNVGGMTFEGQIAGGINPAVVQYYVVATDNQGNTETFPEEGANGPLFFKVGTLTPVLVTEFENGGSGFTSGFAGDTATTGLWELGNPVGTAAQPEDDHTASGTNCWFTGQGAVGGAVGANDVDGGRTTLVSPIFDASGAAGVSLTYWRWYSNDQGGAPNADVFRVGVSNDGGATWSNAEQVGPSGPGTEGGWIRSDIELSFAVAPTANMQVRFVADDSGTGSIVEAAIDDIEITVLTSGIPQPSNYCTANPNSTGAVASISWAGSYAVADNDFTLLASGMPSTSFGLFFFGSMQIQASIPSSDGTLCVAGSTFRLPVTQSDLIGTSFYQLDFTGSTNASVITAGTTWNFQRWFRDSSGGAPTSNTTNGLEVPFQ